MKMIGKVIIPAAGLGRRLLSATKEQPKEMLPLFAANDSGGLCLKPIVQQVFEDLFDYGAREFYFVVGKGKRAIEDHFTPDREFIDRLRSSAKIHQGEPLESFYHRIESSTIVWVNQPMPKGFGHAVLLCENLLSDDPFIVHAGDTRIISRKYNVHNKLMESHAQGRNEVTLTLKQVQDPRQYGVAEVVKDGIERLNVTRCVEKPSVPRSMFAIMPIYAFNSTIFDALRETAPGLGNEIQLTDAIQKIIEAGHRVRAISLANDDIHLDVGTPEMYYQALRLSYDHVLEARLPERTDADRRPESRFAT
jgi:UTP--glucose-1-phosphate uridylyltransferase